MPNKGNSYTIVSCLKNLSYGYALKGMNALNEGINSLLLHIIKLFSFYFHGMG